MFKLENIIKGILFTIVGFVIIGMAIYGWWMDELTDMQAVTGLAIGFIFSAMRTKIDDIVMAFLNKFFGIAPKDGNRDNHKE